jgi:hypothetical protein
MTERHVGVGGDEFCYSDEVIVPELFDDHTCGRE